MSARRSPKHSLPGGDPAPTQDALGSRPWWQTVLLSLAVAGALTLLSVVPGWRLVEARLFDLLSTLAPQSPEEPGAIVVAIDEPSLSDIGRQWPWPRDLHAELIRNLRAAGAKVIAFDVIFAEPSSEEADAALAGVLGPDVVLAADLARIETPQAEQEVRVEPLARFQAAGARSGLASVVLDGDGTLRRMPPYADGLAATALEGGTGRRAPAVPPGALIQFFGPPRTYPTVSYYQALSPETFLPPGFLRGRTVLVGLSLQSAAQADSGAPDVFATPYTVGTGLLTAGVEVQATILDNLRYRLFIRPLPVWVAILALLSAALAGGLLSHRAVTWRSGLATGLLACAILMTSWLLLRQTRVWLAPALPVLACMLVVGVQGGRDFARERRQRQAIARAFAHYLAPELVARLARDPASLRLGGERRTLSILFCDVRGFTTLAEQMKDAPDRLTRLINRLLNPLSEAVLSHGGTIDKYIGDCVMAFWNAPLDDPLHARHAVGCALRMLAEVERLNAALAAENAADAGLRFSVGIGINTGDCVVGNVGSERRFDYSVLGDAVILASRLESSSKRYGVPLMIGPDTKEAVAADFVTVELDLIAVKGRSAACPIFTVLRDVPRSGDPNVAALSREHAAMLAAYRARAWNEAEERIAACRPLAPELNAYYTALLSWISAMRAAPPPPDWQGVYEAVEK